MAQSLARETISKERRLALVAPLAVVCLLNFAPSWAAAADKAAEVKARRAFVSGDFKAALALYEELYAETLHPTYLRNIGRCHQKLGNHARGIEFLQQYLKKGKNVDQQERAEVEGYVAEMEKARAESARAEAPNPTPATEPPKKAAPASTPSPPDLSPKPAEPPAGAIGRPAPADEPPVWKRGWFWGVAAVVVGGAVTAVLLAGRGSSKAPCPTECQ